MLQGTSFELEHTLAFCLSSLLSLDGHLTLLLSLGTSKPDSFFSLFLQHHGSLLHKCDLRSPGSLHFLLLGHLSPLFGSSDSPSVTSSGECLHGLNASSVSSSPVSLLGLAYGLSVSLASLGSSNCSSSGSSLLDPQLMLLPDGGLALLHIGLSLGEHQSLLALGSGSLGPDFAEVSLTPSEHL